MKCQVNHNSKLPAVWVEFTSWARSRLVKRSIVQVGFTESVGMIRARDLDRFTSVSLGPYHHSISRASSLTEPYLASPRV